MLKDNFFKVESVGKSDENTLVRVALNPDHKIYKAHFPGYPITPGVCIVQIAVEIISFLEGREMELCGAKDIKFLVPVEPGKVSHLTYSIKGSSVTVSDDTTLYARMNLFLN